MLDPQTTALLSQIGYDPASVEALLSGGLYLTLATVLAAIPTGMIARRKGRSAARWVLFALSFPLVPLLIIYLLRPLGDDLAGPSNGQGK